jgi:hypothetical protein
MTDKRTVSDAVGGQLPGDCIVGFVIGQSLGSHRGLILRAGARLLRIHPRPTKGICTIAILASSMPTVRPGNRSAFVQVWPNDRAWRLNGRFANGRSPPAMPKARPIRSLSRCRSHQQRFAITLPTASRSWGSATRSNSRRDSNEKGESGKVPLVRARLSLRVAQGAGGSCPWQRAGRYLPLGPGCSAGVL